MLLNQTLKNKRLARNFQIKKTINQTNQSRSILAHDWVPLVHMTLKPWRNTFSRKTTSNTIRLEKLNRTKWTNETQRSLAACLKSGTAILSIWGTKLNLNARFIPQIILLSFSLCSSGRKNLRLKVGQKPKKLQALSLRVSNQKHLVAG